MVGDETVHQPHNRLEYEGDNMVLKYVLGINSRRGGCNWSALFCSAV